MENLEIYLFPAILAGGALLALGSLWLLVRAFRVRFLWGLGLILFAPLALIFIPRHWSRSRAPACLMALGSVVAGASYGISLYQASHIDLGPRDKVVEGERHLTLTGWDRKDYAVLRQCRDVVVLQMANADVSDETLEHLRDLPNLRELDLNYTAVTDAGLAVLSNLPALRSLRLQKTAVTDEGFRAHLLEKDSLLELDVTGTKVASKTLREWKNKNKEERKYVN